MLVSTEKPGLGIGEGQIEFGLWSDNRVLQTVYDPTSSVADRIFAVTRLRPSASPNQPQYSLENVRKNKALRHLITWEGKRIEWLQTGATLRLVPEYAVELALYLLHTTEREGAIGFLKRIPYISEEKQELLLGEKATFQRNVPLRFRPGVPAMPSGVFEQTTKEVQPEEQSEFHMLLTAVDVNYINLMKGRAGNCRGILTRRIIW